MLFSVEKYKESEDKQLFSQEVAWQYVASSRVYLDWNNQKFFTFICVEKGM